MPPESAEIYRRLLLELEVGRVAEHWISTDAEVLAAQLGMGG